jgi:histidyl-tRNA synthetase
MSTPAGPKGTRDFYPEESALQEFVFDSWRRTCRRYGFESYEGPMFESLELFTQKSGAEIERQLYTFQDKGGRDLALRPEMTPTLARMVAAQGTNLKMPLRWFSIPRLFRYEKMQRGRLREFFQLNMDILGVAEVTADAELIAAAIDMMRDLGFTSDDFTVRISSRTLLEDALLAAGLPADRCPALFALLDKKSKIPAEVFDRELAALVPDETIREAVNAVFRAETLADIKAKGLASAALRDLERLFQALSWYGLDDYVAFDIGIVRGLAYYTGIVFEIIDAKRSLRAIAGGGRYDRLVALYGGPVTPAVGFAAGDVVLAELMREKGIVPQRPARSDCYLVALDDSLGEAVIAFAQELRRTGVSCEFPLKNVNVGRQLKLANAARSRYAVFIGGREDAAGMIKIKNMTTGEERLIPRGEAAAALAGMLQERA